MVKEIQCFVKVSFRSTITNSVFGNEKMISVKRFKVDNGPSSGGGYSAASFSSGGSFANGCLEITANSANKSGIDLHAKNLAPDLDYSLKCLNSWEHWPPVS